jgi:hypothetical protein
LPLSLSGIEPLVSGWGDWFVSLPVCQFFARAGIIFIGLAGRMREGLKEQLNSATAEQPAGWKGKERHLGRIFFRN